MSGGGFSFQKPMSGFGQPLQQTSGFGSQQPTGNQQQSQGFSMNQPSTMQQQAPVRYNTKICDSPGPCKAEVEMINQTIMGNEKSCYCLEHKRTQTKSLGEKLAKMNELLNEIQELQYIQINSVVEIKESSRKLCSEVDKTGHVAAKESDDRHHFIDLPSAFFVDIVSRMQSQSSERLKQIEQLERLLLPPSGISGSSSNSLANDPTNTANLASDTILNIIHSQFELFLSVSTKVAQMEESLNHTKQKYTDVRQQLIRDIRRLLPLSERMKDNLAVLRDDPFTNQQSESQKYLDFLRKNPFDSK